MQVDGSPWDGQVAHRIGADSGTGFGDGTGIRSPVLGWFARVMIVAVLMP